MLRLYRIKLNVLLCDVYYCFKYKLNNIDIFYIYEVFQTVLLILFSKQESPPA